MKYILRTLWVIGLIPVFLLGLVCMLVYLMVGFPIVTAFTFIKTGNLDDNDIPLPHIPAEWFLGKYNGLLDKIK